jgi:hypothetical protein
MSIITCINAAEEFLTPSIVISQDSDPIRKRLMSRRVRLGMYFILRHRLKPYVSAKLFLEYINAIFVLQSNKLRDLEELEACEAVLLLDNCSLHISGHFVAVPSMSECQVSALPLMRLTSCKCLI